MKNNIHWKLFILVLFVMVLCPFTYAYSSTDTTLEIIKPSEMQLFYTSNVEFTVMLDFSMEVYPKPFRAWLNGKPVGSLFSLDDLEATALLSADDGVKASMNGPRMNVFRAEVEGPDGKKHRQMLRFLVDCSKNNIPVAEVGPDERVFVNETVALDGIGSADTDGDPLAYQWSFVTVPKKSKAEFSDPSSANPTFVPDMPGIYVAQLIVDDYKAKSEPKTVTVTAVQLKALVDRPVLSQIFERLSRHGIVHQFDGSQPIADYHVAVIDGDAHTAEELIGNQLLIKALAAGKWALVFNVKEDHKDIGLTPHLGIVSEGHSSAYLFRRFLDGNTPVFRIFELPLVDTLEAEINPEIFLKYAGFLLKTLKESWEGSLRIVGAPPPDNDIPTGLINCRWDYQRTLPLHIVGSGRQDYLRTQDASYTVNYTFTLFLDNTNQPGGNKQYLLIQIDAQANPNDLDSHFVATQDDMDRNNEFAWFQDKLTVLLYYYLLNDPHYWSWVGNDPSSANAIHTYSANASFTMGFNQAQGVLGSFSYGCSDSYTLSDWGIKCDSSTDHMYWEILSTDPLQHDEGYSMPNNKGWFQTGGKPKRPNDMAMGQAQYHAAVVWSTDAIVDQMASFVSSISEHMADNWCRKDWGLICSTCCSSNVVNKSLDLKWTIDLGAVIPIKIKEITFSEGPVVDVPPLGKTIQGTVTLEKPAKIDTNITYISSNNNHAVPKINSITIPMGQTSASFDIDLNPEGVPLGTNFFAEISVFYDKDYAQQLTMHAIP